MKQSILSFLLLFFSWLSVSAQNVTLDPSFGLNGTANLGGITNGISQGDGLALQSDGSLIFAGIQNGEIALIKVFDNGKLDSAFLFSQQQNLPLPVSQPALLILHNGKILCTDGFQNMFRFQADGQLDATFGIQGQKQVPNARITKLYELPDGKIVASGYFIDTEVGVRIFRLTADGNLDATFADNGVFTYLNGDISFSFDMNIQPDGKYLLGGCAVSTSTKNLVLRLDTEGKPDNTFGQSGFVYQDSPENSEGFCLDRQSDGKLVLGGYIEDLLQKGAVTRYLTDGALDLGFGVNGTLILPQLKSIADIKVLDDQKIMILGIQLNNNDNVPVFVRLLSTGVLDPTFGTNGIFQDPGILSSNYLGFEQTGNHEFVAYAKDQAAYLFKIITDLSVGTLAPQSAFSTLLYPNPVVETCTVKFNLESPANVSFQLMDMQGKLLEKLVDQEMFLSGEQQKTLHLPATLPAGSYQLFISIGDKSVKSLHIIKS